MLVLESSIPSTVIFSKMKSDRKEEGGNPRIGSIFELILPVHTKRSSAWITCGDVSIIISLYPFLFYRSFSCCCLDSLWINIIDVSLLSLHCQTLKSKIIGFPRLWFGVAKMLFWEFCSSSCVMFAFLYLFICLNMVPKHKRIIHICI